MTSPVDWTAHQVDNTITWGVGQIWHVAGWGAAAIAGVSKAVLHAIQVGVHVSQGMFSRLFSLGHKFTALVSVAAHDAAHLAAGAVDWTKHAGEWFVSQADTWGKAFYDSTVHPAIEAAVKGLHAAGNVASGLIHGLQHTVDWIQHTALPDAEHLAHDALTTADNALKKAEGFVTQDVFNHLQGQVTSLTTEVTSLAAEIPGDLVTILDDVVKAAWFLVKVAEYTPEVVEGLFAAMAAGFDPHELLAKPKDQTGIESQVHTVATKLLGSSSVGPAGPVA